MRIFNKKIKNNSYQELSNSELFNPTWYSETYDVQEDPVNHYLKIGYKLGYNPSVLFSTSLYLHHNIDVKNANINPLVHYLEYGAKEGRQKFSIISEYLSIIDKDWFVQFYKLKYQPFNEKQILDLCKSKYLPSLAYWWTIELVDKISDPNDFYNLFFDNSVKNQCIISVLKEILNADIPILDINYVRSKLNISKEYSDLQVLKEYLNNWKSFSPCKNFDQELFLSNNPKCIEYDVSPIIILFLNKRFVELSNNQNSINKMLNILRNSTSFSTSIYKQERKDYCYYNEEIDLYFDYIKYGRILNLKFSKIFDNMLYENKYNVMSTIGIVHYEICGKNQKLQPIFQDTVIDSNSLHDKSSIKKLKVLFISTTQRNDEPIKDPSTRYRCVHQSQVITKVGGISSVVSLNTFLSSPNINYDVYVFHRPSVITKEAEIVIEKLKKLGKTLIADYDDLIFGDNSIASESSLWKNRSSNLTDEKIISIFENNLTSLRYFDNFTVSTKPLRDLVIASHSNANVRVISNFIPSDFIDANIKYLNKYNLTRDENSIMYCCGTLSHNKDFKLIEDVLFEILESDRNKKLILVGPLDIPVHFKNNPSVYIHSVVPYEKLCSLMAKSACSIAPLEESIFNNCKSKVKFLESSLSGTKLFATPIDDMKEVKDSGVIMPQSPEEWFNSLSTNIMLSPNEQLNRLQYLKDKYSDEYYIQQFTSFFKEI